MHFLTFKKRKEKLYILERLQFVFEQYYNQHYDATYTVSCNLVTFFKMLDDEMLSMCRF